MSGTNPCEKHRKAQVESFGWVAVDMRPCQECAKERGEPPTTDAGVTMDYDLLVKQSAKLLRDWAKRALDECVFSNATLRGLEDAISNYDFLVTNMFPKPEDTVNA